MHRGETFVIKSLDLERGIAEATQQEVDYYTVLAHTSDIEIKKKLDSRMTSLGELVLGEVKVHEEFGGYKMKQGDRILGYHELDLPASDFETVAIWYALPDSLAAQIHEAGLDWPGGLHAAEHAMIAMTPIHAMCDRWDIGGLSMPYHPDTERATIFIYDGYAGGIGIAEKAFQLFDQLTSTTLELVRDCECESGCPSCIYSPKCGNNNEPLDKKAAEIILASL